MTANAHCHGREKGHRSRWFATQTVTMSMCRSTVHCTLNAQFFTECTSEFLSCCLAILCSGLNAPFNAPKNTTRASTHDYVLAILDEYVSCIRHTPVCIDFELQPISCTRRQRFYLIFSTNTKVLLRVYYYVVILCRRVCSFPANTSQTCTNTLACVHSASGYGS